MKPKICIGSAVICLSLAACGGAAASPSPGAPTSPGSAGASSTTAAQGFGTLKDVIAGATKEGGLKATWSQDTLGGAQGFQQIGDAIDKKYGVKLKYEWAPGADMGSIAARIIQEQAASQPASTDVYIGTDAAFPLVREKHAMRTLDWQALSDGRITSEIAVKDDAGVKIDSRFVGVPYNTNLVKGADIPQQLADVLKTKWKGMIASTPYAASLSDLPSPKLLGGEKADAFMAEFVPYVGGLIRCGEEQRVASGEFAMMVLDCGADPTEELQQHGAPIAHAILKDAAMINIDRLGVPANSAHPHAAALFILYLSTPEGQAMIFKLQHIDLHYYPETHQHQELVALQAKGINPLPLTADNEAGFNPRDYQAKYTKMLASASGK